MQSSTGGNLALLHVFLIIPFTVLAIANNVPKKISHNRNLIDSLTTVDIASTIDGKSLNLPENYLRQLTSIGHIVSPASPVEERISWASAEQLGISRNPEKSRDFNQLLTRIQKEGRLVSRFDGRNLLEVPFGIQGHFGAFAFQLVFDNLQLYPEYAQMDVVAGLYHPLLTDTLFFAAKSIKYNNRSGFLGDAILHLFQDVPVELHSGKSALIFRAPRSDSRGSFIRFDCDGINEIGLSLSICFNPAIIKPADQSSDLVQSHTEFVYKQGSGFILERFNLPPFSLQGFDDLIFSVDNMVLDLDESSSQFTYIGNYFDRIKRASKITPGHNPVEWTGFYCERFSVFINKNHLQNKQGNPVFVEGQDLVIDPLGFSAHVLVENKDILSLSQGNLAGWAFSIDRFHLDILANSIRAFRFGGLIHIPLLDKESQNNFVPTSSDKPVTTHAEATSSLAYEAGYNRDEECLELTVANFDQGSLTIPALLSKVNIYEGSYLRVSSDRKTRIDAYLNGELQLAGRVGDSEIKSSPIQFQGLYVSNQAPYFALRGLAVGGLQAKIGSFSLSLGGFSITDHEPTKYGGQLKRLRLDSTRVELGDLQSGDALSLTTSLNILFGVQNRDGKQQWSCHGFDLDECQFEGQLPGTEYVRGEVRFFFDHPEYAEGFAGHGRVKLDVVPLELDMQCLFGTSDKGFKYCYVDAMAHFETPATTQDNQGGLQVYSMIGGYVKNMERNDINQFYRDRSEDNSFPGLGGCLPANKFIPKKGGQGIKGGILAAIGKAAITGLRIEHEMFPSEGQGLASRFYLEGLIELLPRSVQESRVHKRIVEAGEAADPYGSNVVPSEFGKGGAMGGYISIQLLKDRNGKTFDGRFGVHGEIGSVGINFYGEYFHSPENWHLFLGKPNHNQRLKLRYHKHIAEFLQASLELSSYLMMGNSDIMPDHPPPPYSTNAMNQDLLLAAYDRLHAEERHNVFRSSEYQLANGKSFAFGSTFNAQLELDIAFLVVSAAATVGFDVLLAKGMAGCNREELQETGINEWYLMGQFYAGLAARVGLRVANRLFEIFHAGVALTLSGAGFNPTYGAGTWEFRYKILWIEGTAHGLFKYGDPCFNYSNSIPSGQFLENIYSSRPIPGIMEGEGTEVNINSDFHIRFSLPVDRPFVENTTNFSTGKNKSHELKLRNIVFLRNQSGKVVPADILYTANGYELVIKPREMLPPGEELNLEIESIINDSDGKPFAIDDLTFSVDTMVTFRVSNRGISDLSRDDLVTSYPLSDQEYFHPDEYNLMMVDFGKDLPMNANALSTKLLSVDQGVAEEIEESVAMLEGSRLIQPAFTNMETGKKYIWRIYRSSEDSGRVSFLEIPFTTSRFRTAAAKFRTASILGPSLDSLKKGSDHLHLLWESAEALEFYSGSYLTRFYSSAKPVEPSDPPTGKPIKVKDPGEIIPGENYLTRFETNYQAQDKYAYFHEIQQYLPYGRQLNFKCRPDDIASTGNPPTSSANRTYTLTMPSFKPRNLKLDRMKIVYDIWTDFQEDQIKFRALYPEVPANYIDCYCEGMKTTPIPWYQKGTYTVTARYYLPGFETYSSTKVSLPFDVR